MTTLYQRVSRPERRKAQLVNEEGDKRTFIAKNVTRRTFRASHWALMEPVETGTSETTTAIHVAHRSVSEGTDLRARSMRMQICKRGYL